MGEPWRGVELAFDLASEAAWASFVPLVGAGGRLPDCGPSVDIARGVIGGVFFKRTVPLRLSVSFVSSKCDFEIEISELRNLDVVGLAGVDE